MFSVGTSPFAPQCLGRYPLATFELGKHAWTGTLEPGESSWTGVTEDAEPALGVLSLPKGCFAVFGVPIETVECVRSCGMSSVFASGIMLPLDRTSVE
jgi:hypothetical protein